MQNSATSTRAAVATTANGLAASRFAPVTFSPKTEQSAEEEELPGLLATVVVNVIIGIERVDGGDVVFDDSVSQLFDAQRVGLVFGAALPLALALCVAIVPLQLGARAIAFPRLATIGFWLWFGVRS